MSRLTEAGGAFVKSTASRGDGNCVEAAATLGGVILRDSKDPTGPVLDFSTEEWAAFLTGAMAGEFNLS